MRRDLLTVASSLIDEGVNSGAAASSSTGRHYQRGPRRGSPNRWFESTASAEAIRWRVDYFIPVAQREQAPFRNRILAFIVRLDSSSVSTQTKSPIKTCLCTSVPQNTTNIRARNFALVHVVRYKCSICEHSGIHMTHQYSPCLVAHQCPYCYTDRYK